MRARLVRPLPLLALFALVVALATLGVVRAAAAGIHPELLADAMILDLVVTVPLAYWLLAVRGAGWPRISVLPVIVLSTVVARLVPGLDRGGLLPAAEWLVVPAELLLLTFVARRAIAAGRDLRRGDRSDALEALRRAAMELAEVERAADVIAYEAAVVWYAMSRNPRRDPRDVETFVTRGRGAYAAVLAGLLPVLLIETLAVHFLVRHWSPLAAWILTALSVYAVVWLIGDFRALGRRRTQLTDEALVLRLGLRWTIRVPFSDIRSVSEHPEEAPADRLRAVVLGAEEQVVELRRPVEAIGFYGIRRRVRSIGLSVEDAERFLTLLRSRIVPRDD